MVSLNLVTLCIDSIKCVVGETFLTFNPFQPSVAFYIKTSHLICHANQMTGFYINATPGWNGFRYDL